MDVPAEASKEASRTNQVFTTFRGIPKLFFSARGFEGWSEGQVMNTRSSLDSSAALSLGRLAMSRIETASAHEHLTLSGIFVRA